ncbi:MAG: nucleotidyltransferase family protein [Candidatus Hydrogenedentes bacterium]|nr:nucleotidyltransferase family protein [Candidatus Hydrogenedentota bacterium]MBI3117718.1 nucleotidyltransferase family protein [Candidatus Hydrogenedentota bacterium]
MELPIQVNRDEIAVFCVRHHITRLSFFGSVLREDFGPESDVDVLVEFDRQHIPTLIDMYDMEEELTAMFGHKVDLRTPKELSRYFRDKVLQTALVQYAA